MHDKALAPTTYKAFAALSKITEVNKFYLAGGSNVALHLAHRFSNDLDFFSQTRMDVNKLRAKIDIVQPIDVEFSSDDTLLGKFMDTKVSFFYYQYPLLYQTKKFQGINIADLRDIAAMKVEAISSRGTKRDFVDLYFMVNDKQWPLDFIIGWFKQKYKNSDYNLIHTLNSFSYFKDADKDKDLEMIRPVKWETVKKFFKDAVRNYKI